MAFYYPFNGTHNVDLFNKTIESLNRSKSLVKFKNNILITSKSICQNFHSELLELGIECQPTYCKVSDLNGYSKYMIYDLYKHFDTDFILTTQHDGFIINESSWTDEFLNYDYIGAPWPIKQDAYISPFNEHIRVGNGGFSLRSSKLTKTPCDIEIPFDCTSGDFYKHFNQNNFNEDGCISVHNRHLFEKNGCVFAPVELASRFSQELNVPENYGIKPFGFHKFINGGLFV